MSRKKIVLAAVLLLAAIVLYWKLFSGVTAEEMEAIAALDRAEKHDWY